MDNENMYRIELNGNVEDVLAALEFLAENPDWLAEGDGPTIADLEKDIRD